MAESFMAPGRKFEEEVADYFRILGSKKVEVNRQIAGNQIDVYVEEETPSGSIVRVIVECKDYQNTVGVSKINAFASVLERVLAAGMADRGVFVARSGYSTEGRNAAAAAGVLLLTANDIRTRVRLSSITECPVESTQKVIKNDSKHERQLRLFPQWIYSSQRQRIVVIALGGVIVFASIWIAAKQAFEHEDHHVLRILPGTSLIRYLPSRKSAADSEYDLYITIADNEPYPVRVFDLRLLCIGEGEQKSDNFDGQCTPDAARRIVEEYLKDGVVSHGDLAERLSYWWSRPRMEEFDVLKGGEKIGFMLRSRDGFHTVDLTPHAYIVSSSPEVETLYLEFHSETWRDD